MDHTVARRNFLLGTLGAGSMLTLAACGGGDGGAAPPSGSIAPSPTENPPATAPSVAPAASGPLPPVRLFSDDSMNFDALLGLGESGYGISEVGEVLTAVDEANAAGATYDSYTTAFRAMGDRLATRSDEAAAAGRDVTSRATALRAANYYTRALFFVLGSAQPELEPDVYEDVRRSWDRGVGAFRPAVEYLDVPYDGGSMPAWFFRPDDSGRARRTVIVNNGSDAQAVELVAYGVQAALERGWNAVVFEGPGQGSMLFRQKIVFRPDWENVIGPVIDAVSGRADVDEDRIAVTGWSFGGVLVPRAAAFDHRIAAIVADPGVVDGWEAFPESIRAIVQPGDPQATNDIWNNEVVPVVSPPERFTLAKRLEIFSVEALDAARQGGLPTDFASLAALIEQFEVRDTASQIRCPTLVVDYDDEQFYPGQPEELFELLTTERKDYVKLTAADGAQMHCAPMAPRHRNEVVFDWLDDVLPA